MPVHEQGCRARPVFLVIDDHPLFCEALRIALTADLAAAQVRTAGSLGAGFEALEADAEVDAVLLDLNLPDVDGMDGLLRLKDAYPRAPVVIVSGLDDRRIIAAALDAGASGFVPKDSSKEQIADGLRVVLRGDIYTPPGYAPLEDNDEPEMDSSAIGRLKDLTPQQRRILDLVCEGLLNKQIAFDLSIAETTVKAHITAILRKLGVSSRTQAVLVAQQARYREILQGDGAAG